MTCSLKHAWCARSLEFQVHGPVRFKEDIAAIVVPVRAPLFPPLTKSLGSLCELSIGPQEQYRETQVRTRGSRMSQSVGSLVEKFCAKFGCMVDWAPRPPAGASANASAAAGARFAGAGAAAAAFAPSSSYMYAAGAGPTPAGAPAVDRAGGGRREVVDRLSRALDKPEEFGEWKTAWNRAHGRWYWCVPYRCRSS